jgi:hypothetical protein
MPGAGNRYQEMAVMATPPHSGVRVFAGRGTLKREAGNPAD